MRLVLDTNVVLSGLLWHSHPRRLLDLAKDETVSLYTSSALLDELADVLSRGKWAAMLATRQTHAAFFDAALRRAGQGGPAQERRTRRAQTIRMTMRSSPAPWPPGLISSSPVTSTYTAWAVSTKASPSSLPHRPSNALRLPEQQFPRDGGRHGVQGDRECNERECKAGECKGTDHDIRPGMASPHAVNRGLSPLSLPLSLLSQIHQTLHPFGLESRYLTTKGASAHPQQVPRFLLRQALVLPTFVRLLKSHSPRLL